MFCAQCGAESQSGARFCSTCGGPLERDGQLESQAIQAAAQQYAGFWLRAVAAMIDGFLCQIATMMVAFPLGFTMGVTAAPVLPVPDIEFAATGIGFGVGLMMQWLWFTVAESSVWQASIGKKILGLTVTDLEGNRIDFGRANGRYWSKMLSGLFFGLGFFMVAFTDKKQGLHDKLAGTLVLRDAKY